MDAYSFLTTMHEQAQNLKLTAYVRWQEAVNDGKTPKNVQDELKKAADKASTEADIVTKAVVDGVKAAAKLIAGAESVAD